MEFKMGDYVYHKKSIYHQGVIVDMRLPDGQIGVKQNGTGTYVWYSHHTRLERRKTRRVV